MTIIEGVVAPVFQTPPTLPESVTLPPTQNVVGPLAVMTEAIGRIATSTRVLLLVEIAPVRERMRPMRLAPFDKLTAPLTRAVPLKTEFTPKSNCPLICQKTLHRDAPLRSKTREPTPVANAPFILKIKRALGSFPASNTKSPFKVDAAPRQ